MNLSGQEPAIQYVIVVPVSLVSAAEPEGGARSRSILSAEQIAAHSGSRALFSDVECHRFVTFS